MWCEKCKNLVTVQTDCFDYDTCKLDHTCLPTYDKPTFFEMVDIDFILDVRRIRAKHKLENHRIVTRPTK